ncbi:hypothetical protein ACF0H5_005922 [Mactra antiquata]
MSQDKPKRKLSAALQPPNLSDTGHGLATISETQTLRKTSQDHGAGRKVSTEYVGLRRVSQEPNDAKRKDSRKVSTFSSIGRKTSFMNVPEKLLKDKALSCKSMGLDDEK